jgi:PmbA protein
MDRDFAADLVARAMRRGATGCEVVIRDGTEFSATVRLGEVETLTQAASKALGLRVLVGGRQASVATSDFSPGAVDAMIDEALALARATSPDETADLPDGPFAGDAPDLEIYDPEVEALAPEAGIELALRAERAALDTDPRVANFDRGSVSTAAVTTILANSRGFAGAYRSTSTSLLVAPVAEQGGEKQRDYWYDARRALGDLEAPETIGRRAAERAARKLGARKIASCEVPVVFEQAPARDLVGCILRAVSGEAVYRKASFLADLLGEQVAAPGVTVIDDGRLPKGLGSRPFDAEGIATRRTTVLADGRLEAYLLDTFTGRRLGAPSTGNAVRGVAGRPGVGACNLYLEAGPHDPSEIVRSLDRGLVVTELIGFGVNIVNGDYSRGAAGLWVERGEVVHPVHEITIAGNLKEMLRGITMVGNDLEFRGAMAAPTLRIERMAVSGQ